MWLLPVEIPEEARAALPPGRYLLPWYYTADDVARFAGVARRLLCGIDHELRLPWEAVPVIAKGAPGSLDRTLLVVRVEDAALDEEAIERGLSELRCRYTLVQSPAPRETGYAWQEQHLKPALVSLLREHVGNPAHPLASLNIGELPVLLAASLTPDALEMLDLLEAALTHRLRYARYGATESDWWRSLMLSAGRRLAGRLNRLPAEEAGCALEALLGAGGGAGERFEAGAAALEKVGLGRVVAGSLSVGPLGRAVRERPVWGGLVEELVAGVWTPAARRELAGLSAPGAEEEDAAFVPLGATIGESALEELSISVPDLAGVLDGPPPDEPRAKVVWTIRKLREAERSAPPRAQSVFRFWRTYLLTLSAVHEGDIEKTGALIDEMDAILELGADASPGLTKLAGIARALAAMKMLQNPQDRAAIDRATGLARRVLALPDQDPRSIVSAHIVLGSAAHHDRDERRASDEYHRALNIAVQQHLPGLAAMAAAQLAIVAASQGDAAMVSELIAGYPEITENPRLQAALGVMHALQGDEDESRERLKTALELSLRRGDEQSTAEVQMQLGGLALARDNLDEARALWSEALETFKRREMKKGQAIVHSHLGILAERLSAFDEARRHYEDALRLAEPFKDQALLERISAALERLTPPTSSAAPSRSA